MRILIVDDSKFSCKRTKEMFESIDASYDVQISFSPVEALELVTNGENQYDAVFLDFNMPEMNGLELAEKVKSIVPYEKVFLLTATSAFATNSQEVPEGMTLIQKPASVDKLRNALVQLGNAA